MEIVLPVTTGGVSTDSWHIEAKPSAMYRTSPTTENYPAQTLMAPWEKLWPGGDCQFRDNARLPLPCFPGMETDLQERSIQQVFVESLFIN